jgi:hypothetical protein
MSIFLFAICCIIFGDALTVCNDDDCRMVSRDVAERKGIGADRTYYIAAVEIMWDYAPPGTTSPSTGLPVQDDATASIFTKPNNVDRIGSIYKKCVYREFEDDTFDAQVVRDSRWKHLGVLGPVIRGVVGERLKIIFKNKCSFDFSMHPHGLEYNKESEGAKYEHNDIETGETDPNWDESVSEGGQRVLPEQQWVYIWDINDQFNDKDDDEFTSKLWWYHSHINEPKDTNSGLVGPIIISKADDENVDGIPAGIDREFVTLFTVFDENKSWYLAENVANIRSSSGSHSSSHSSSSHSSSRSSSGKKQNKLLNDRGFIESNLMHAMNGYIYNALGPYLGGIQLGERIRWYIGGMGTEVDTHTAHWHGHILLANTFIYHDVVRLLPAFTMEADMITDNPGEWLYHCHVNNHLTAGMTATYTVLDEVCEDCNGIDGFFGAEDAEDDAEEEEGGEDDNVINNDANSNVEFGVDDIDNNNNNYSFEMVVSSGYTWIIVFIACLVNVIIVICLFIAYLKCKFKGTMTNKKEYNFGHGDVEKIENMEDIEENSVIHNINDGATSTI